jgi:hypothetical protein
MKKFAIIENNLVLNTVIAENVEILQEILPGKQYIEFTDDQENKPVIGLKYENGIFEQPVSEILIEDNDTIVEDAVVEDAPTE